jgi:hypothetical protein
MSLLDYMRIARGVGSGKYEEYLPIYERHFKRWAGLSPTILEIGVGEGSSLAMWHLFFGCHAKVYGIDIVEKGQQTLLGSKMFIGRQEDTEFLGTVLEEIGPPDIVVDDGSHVSEQIAKSFGFLYPRMSKHGIYLVEDLHVRWARDFFEYAKSLVDNLTLAWSPPNMDFHTTTMSMHFYDSVVVFERGRPRDIGKPGPDSFVTIPGQP